MKKLSDYKGNEAIELYGDLLEPLSVIFTDEEIRKMSKEKKTSRLKMASVALKKYPDEITKILFRIDPEPIDGANIVARLISVLADIGKVDGLKDFFPSAEQETEET